MGPGADYGSLDVHNSGGTPRLLPRWLFLQLARGHASRVFSPGRYGNSLQEMRCREDRVGSPRPAVRDCQSVWIPAAEVLPVSSSTAHPARSEAGAKAAGEGRGEEVRCLPALRQLRLPPVSTPHVGTPHRARADGPLPCLPGAISPPHRALLVGKKNQERMTAQPLF